MAEQVSCTVHVADWGHNCTKVGNLLGNCIILLYWTATNDANTFHHEINRLWSLENHVYIVCVDTKE